MARELTINGTRIADDTDCYVIAEIGSNHGGSVETCKQMIEAAHDAGANAVKLQKRDNRTLYTKAFYDSPYNSEHAYGPTYGLHREALEFDFEQYAELKATADSIGIAFFATAFDQPSVDFLARLGVPAIKIASGDLTNLPLIRCAAQAGVPLIISTGGVSIGRVIHAAVVASDHATDFALLQCTASYPVDWAEMDLRVIEDYRERFPQQVIGLSAHDNGIAMAVAAYTLGARIVEKHFTLNRASKGSDHAFSLEPQGLRKLVRDLRRTRLALGDGEKRCYPSEAAPISKMAKSAYAARPIAAGHVLTAEDIVFKSPAHNAGFRPDHDDVLIGKRWPVAMEPDDLFTDQDWVRAQ